MTSYIVLSVEVFFKGHLNYLNLGYVMHQRCSVHKTQRCEMVPKLESVNCKTPTICGLGNGGGKGVSDNFSAFEGLAVHELSAVLSLSGLAGVFWGGWDLPKFLERLAASVPHGVLLSVFEG